MTNILDYFPFPSFRPYQEDILLKIQDYIDSYSHIMYEAPVGSGKSGVGIAVAKWLLAERGELTNIGCAEECFVPFESYINNITETLGSSEYRTIDHLRILLKSSAALDGRDTVNIKDIALISELTKWMNLDYNPMGDLSEG